MNKKELIEKYPYAIAVDSVNYTGIEIHAILHDIDDKVFGVDGKDLFINKMYFTEDNESYFVRQGKKHFIHNFLKV